MTRTRAWLVLGLLVVVLMTAAAPPAQALGRGSRMFRIVNRVRVHHDLRPLVKDRDLSRDARHHSRKMAEARTLYHSTDLASRASAFDASSWGENVAQAGTLKRACRLWMRSADHRRNIMKGSFDHAGVGVVRSHGWLWITFDFFG